MKWKKHTPLHFSSLHLLPLLHIPINLLMLSKEQVSSQFSISSFIHQIFAFYDLFQLLYSIQFSFCKFIQVLLSRTGLTFSSSLFGCVGSLWTAIAHIITGVIGSGVLSLAWSMAQLGWIAGPLSMLLFAVITIVSAFLLCDSYRSPDPEIGSIRNRSYLDAVRLNLGIFFIKKKFI